MKVSKKARKNKVPTKQEKEDTLDPEYWSVPQVSVAKLDPDVPGVAFVKPAEARELCARPTAQCAQALLCSAPVNGNGVGVNVPVHDANGRPQTFFRYLVQIGSTPVEFNKSAIPAGTNPTKETIRVAVNLQKGKVDNDVWERAMQLDPEGFVKEWLTSNGIKFLDVLPPRASMSGNVRVIAWIAKTSEAYLQQTVRFSWYCYWNVLRE